MSVLRFTIPVEVRSANVMIRQHWATAQRLAKSERRATFYSAVASGFRKWEGAAPFVVTFNRIYGPRGKAFDEGDNLALGFKHVRDEIARLLGVDDSPTSPATWIYQQERGEKCAAVCVSIHGEERTS